MALSYLHAARKARPARWWGPLYAWSGSAVMGAFWVCFAVFLASPPWAPRYWPLPTVDRGGLGVSYVSSAFIDVALISLFGLQHSLMARPWFKKRFMWHMPPAFQRCTFVHAANLALFALILFWQPIPVELWSLRSPLRDAIWVAYAAGWLILLLGALSFGILDLLGIEQMRAWYRGAAPPPERLRTGLLYRWIPHPMYVGLLLAAWATPRMTIGHLLMAGGLTLYVLIAMRYEERDLAARFGNEYVLWRMRERD
jgi:methanethiol S-methyltransferase